MQQFARLAAAITLAFLMITSYMISDPPFNAFFNFFGIASSNDHVSSVFKYINESTERVQDGYLVWSSGCRIVDVPAWDKSLKGFVGKSIKVNCPGKRLSKVKGEAYSRRLEISPALQTTSCCLRQITRKDNTSSHIKTPDDIYKISKCQQVNLTATLPEDAQFIWIRCAKKGKTEKEVYSNMHSFVGKTDVVEEKLKKQTEAFKEGKMSVLVLGIDSISRLNLIRTMPKTVKYLNSHGWIDLKGYNKIDDNTFPNLMAILNGMTVNQVKNACWPTPSTKMDECPFIWKDFSDRGYVTAYAEDEPSISSFNYHKKGFAKSPTDYYLRPYMLAAEKYLKTKMMEGLHVCYGPNHSAELILDYAVDFATVFHNALYFALFWMNSFSHNDVNMPAAFDDRILKFLRDIEKSGTLNTTLVVFLSDHGMRFGKIRETFVGWLEERLPFIYFWVPKLFKTAYPDKYENIIINRNRLSSPFDLHLTLKEIAGEEQEGTKACKTCYSLMKELNWNRTCQEAGISGHWCTCSEYKSLSPQGSNVEVMAKSVVDHINGIVNNRSKEKLKAGMKCLPLKLNRVLSLRSRVPPGPQQDVILLETKPGGALFEATIAPDKTPVIVDAISRINSYAKHSYCMNDAYLKNFCYCKAIHR